LFNVDLAQLLNIRRSSTPDSLSLLYL